MNTLDSYMVYGIIALLLVVIISTICILRSPFHYPYFIHSFDVSGKRAPQIEDLVDEFLNAGNFYR
ncbi:HNH endonuclease, partial [[Clostridium] innocuum]